MCASRTDGAGANSLIRAGLSDRSGACPPYSLLFNTVFRTSVTKVSEKFSFSLSKAVIVLVALVLPCLIAAVTPSQRPLPQIRPQVPGANRNNTSRVFLERADLLEKAETDSFLVLVGNVHFSRGAMQMYCDSAHYFPESEAMDAFGSVRMEQGDTLFVFADELNYRDRLAVLYGTPGAPVRMINRDVTLTTDEFIYDLAAEFGYYTHGGTLTDAGNRLTSVQGEYVPATKEANFYDDVHLNSINRKNDTLDIYTDTLYYNTDSRIAQLHSPSRIINRDATIYTSSGTYNTNTNISELFDRSRVITSRGSTLEGDTLYYDRAAGFGEAFGRMVLTDSVRQTSLSGDYGYYNELIDSAFVTGRALAKEYSREDTLYMHGRQIRMFRQIDTIRTEADTLAGIPAGLRIDTTHVTVAHPRVRFYRSDMQGICDSMRFVQRDSTLYMMRHPVVWSGNRQIFGNIIQVHFNDSTADHAVLPDFAFSAEHIEDAFFNQLSGKEMIAHFTDSHLSRLQVNGNVQAIMLPQENDSTYNKIVNMESSFLDATFTPDNLDRMKLWPETSGTVTPLYLAKKSLFRLPRFRWFDLLRPTSPESVFIIPPEMDALMQEE